jgi:hypothetical protein
VGKIDVEAFEASGGRIAVAPAVAVLIDADDQLAPLADRRDVRPVGGRRQQGALRFYAAVRLGGRG